MNFFDVTIEGNEVIFSDGNKITLPDNVIRQLGGKTNGLIMGVRGEDIKLDAQNIDVYSETKQSAVVENAEVMGNENKSVLYIRWSSGCCKSVKIRDKPRRRYDRFRVCAFKAAFL